MDDTRGQVYLEPGGRSPDLNAPGFPEEKKYSDETSRDIDKAVRRILDEQYIHAQDIINKHRQVLEEGAQLLLKKEKIEGSELKVILDKETLSDSSA